MTPFLKWPGGKRWLINYHSDLLPNRFKRYFEPFLGAGSVYFHLEPERAVLADTNEELVATYLAIRENWQRVLRTLQRHHNRHGEDHYYQVRSRNPRSPVNRAARMIYLNRTCFNGIYRVNREGLFNVPIGSRSSVLFDTDDFESTARLLATADLRASDFEGVIDEARKGDFVFADPPYTVNHNNNGFMRYNEKLFSWEDQQRLAKALSRARDRGVIILASNADHFSLRELYVDYGFTPQSVERFSPISSTGENRKQFQELILQANYPGAQQ